MFKEIEVKLPEKVSKTTGEIVRAEKIIKVISNPDCPYRTIRDLKGYEDAECNTEPSMTNTQDYVPTRVLIQRMLQRHSLAELRMMAEQDALLHPEDYDSEEQDIDTVTDDAQDDLELMDQISDLQSLAEEQASQSSLEHQQSRSSSEQSVSDANEKERKVEAQEE